MTGAHPMSDLSPSLNVRDAVPLSPIVVHKGRGALSRPPGRFERWQRVADADTAQPDPDPAVGAPAAPATTIEIIDTRTAITRNQSPDIAFDRSLNPYRGCEHGCIYCYARPVYSYHGMSPGLDFETRIGARTTLPERLARELDAPGYRCAPINIGSATDPYQPAERGLGITRRLIEILLQRGHPFTIVTKGALIERDLDLLARAAERSLVEVFVSVSTLDPGLARLWDPRASAPWRRLRTIGALSAAGVPTGVLAAPIAPFLNDHDLEAIVEAAAGQGAVSAHYTLLRLPHEVLPLFEEWLGTHFPDRARRVLARIRDLRGGDRLNDGRFFSRMHGQGPWGALISSRFRLAVRRHGLSRQRRALDCSQFAAHGSQASLF